MTAEDKRFYNELRTKQQVFNQQGKILSNLVEKLKKKQPIFGISTRVMFGNKEVIPFNVGTLGLSSDKCVKAYEVYINTLLENLKEEYQDNNLKIIAMESKINAEKISR